jgi:CRP-like cAMP-binding protein
MDLRQYFARFVQISDTEWNFFSGELKPVSLQKGDYFFRQGEASGEIGFVITGLLCNFYTGDDGVDHVKKFSVPGTPVASYASMILQRPSIYSCQALEAVQLMTLKFSVLQELYRRDPCWERLGRVIAENLYLEKEFREREFLVDDAKTRYENFKKQKPELLDQVPQYLIASYLGVTPASLSRLKQG